MLKTKTKQKLTQITVRSLPTRSTIARVHIYQVVTRGTIVARVTRTLVNVYK